MKIAIDYSLADTHIGGMGVFVRNIVKQLNKVDKKNDYILFENPYGFKAKNLFTKITSVINAHLWYQTGFLSELYRNNIDLLLSPNPPVPLFFNKPLIITIPDLAFYSEKRLFCLVKIFLYLNYFLAAKKAMKVITFSEYSKKDIEEILRVGKEKIEVIPLAASKEFKASKDKKSITKTLKRHKINTPYILSTPGTFLPRKNIKDLIIAVASLPPKIRNSTSVVLVGKDHGPDFEKLNNFIKEVEMSQQVIFTGYIKLNEIVNLYSAARLFVYPSLYEGFGLPPLEAMSCGVPVIVYNKTSLPEVVGNAAIIVANTNQLSAAIKEVLRKSSLRKRLIKEGFKRSKLYNWNNTALSIKNLINKNESYFLQTKRQVEMKKGKDV